MFCLIRARTEYRRVYRDNEAWLLDMVKRQIEDEWEGPVSDGVLEFAMRVARVQHLSEFFEAMRGFDREWARAGMDVSGVSGMQMGLVNIAKDVLETHGFEVDRR